MERVQPNADLKRLCLYGDFLGLLLMQARGSFLTVMVHVQNSAFF